ncbi:MAG: Zn-ribbon domain-containing OB-fold protein [Pseudomonadota bacterium]|nr:Zn-ribbon domain-containing OB-fold protein [Pseudomonadota bacterium]
MSENLTPKPVPRPNGDTQPFWDACNEERLVYQSCQSCGHAQFYPRSACVKCESTDLAWKEADPTGTVHTFTIVNRAPSAAFRSDVPYVLALIDLADGFRMMMNVTDCDPADVAIGKPVRIVYEQRDGQKVPQATLVR